MKKSKKLLALLLCLAMVFGLAACGNSNKPANSQTPAPGTNTETPAHETETPGETEADPDAIEDSMTLRRQQVSGGLRHRRRPVEGQVL